MIFTKILEFFFFQSDCFLMILDHIFVTNITYGGEKVLNMKKKTKKKHVSVDFGSFLVEI